MATVVPTQITEQIREFVRTRIDTNVAPQFIPITPDRGCKPGDCFMNIKAKVEREGGQIQFGWAIWEWPGAFLEAEHHAVYEREESHQSIDPTPCERGSRQRLFVPDDSAVYDFENEGVLKDNLRFALVDDPLIDELFKAAAKKAAFMNELPGVGVIQIHASEDKQLQKILRRISRATEEIAQKYPAAK